MRRRKPVSVKVRAPSRGLVVRLPGESADLLPPVGLPAGLPTGTLSIPGTQQRAAAAASNVRYEDGVIANAPGYEKVELNSSLLTGIVAYWNLDEASGPRADSTTGGHTLAEIGGTESTIVPSDAGKINQGADFVALSFEAVAQDSLTLDSRVSGFISLFTDWAHDITSLDNSLAGGYINPVIIRAPNDKLTLDNSLSGGSLTMTVIFGTPPSDSSLLDNTLDSGTYTLTVVSDSAPSDSSLLDNTLDTGTYTLVVITTGPLGDGAPYDKLTLDSTFASGGYTETIGATESPEDSFTLTCSLVSGSYG